MLLNSLEETLRIALEMRAKSIEGMSDDEEESEDESYGEW